MFYIIYSVLFVAVIIFSISAGALIRRNDRAPKICLVAALIITLLGVALINKVENRVMERNKSTITKETANVEWYNNRLKLNEGIYSFSNLKLIEHNRAENIGKRCHSVEINGMEVKHLNVIFLEAQMRTNHNFTDPNTVQIVLESYLGQCEPVFIFPNKE